MSQYIIVFPSIGDSIRDYRGFPLPPFNESAVLNYSNLQLLIYRLVNNDRIPITLFIPTINSITTYTLCSTLEEVKEKTVLWRRHCLSEITLQPYLIELSKDVMPGNRFPMETIIKIFKINVQVFPTELFETIEKWSNPKFRMPAPGRVDSAASFFSAIFGNRGRSSTH